MLPSENILYRSNFTSFIKGVFVYFYRRLRRAVRKIKILDTYRPLLFVFGGDTHSNFFINYL